MRLRRTAQAELWPAWRHFCLITNRDEDIALVEAEHREHGAGEQVADLKDQALTHFPSGHFHANGAWTVLAALAQNLLRWTQLLGLPNTDRPRRLHPAPPAAAGLGRLTQHARGWTLHLAAAGHVGSPASRASPSSRTAPGLAPSSHPIGGFGLVPLEAEWRPNRAGRAPPCLSARGEESTLTLMQRRTDCCVVGGGPAGMVLAVLLARAGVRVTVLEKHDDFLRDFRGDTVHASSLTLLDELGLGERFSALPHRLVQRMPVPLLPGVRSGVDLRLLPGPHKHIAMVPQWDLLALLADAGRREPSFTLRMGVEVTGLLREHGRVVGVRYRDADAREGQLRAAVTVACDGRTSTVRSASGLGVREFGVPMDVWWFRLPRRKSDLQGLDVRAGDGALLVMIDRGSYFQVGYQIRKGSDARLRAEGIEAFHRRVAALAPEFAGRVGAVSDWDDVKLLAVRLDRMSRWFSPGLLCIGDAAHAMSPVGGVGINLAIQDAVAAARYLAEPLRRGEVRLSDLARVQVRRWAPTFVTQSLQQLAHRLVFEPVLAGEPRKADLRGPSRPARLLQRFPRLQAIPAYIVAIGVLPEHAPPFARRS